MTIAPSSSEPDQTESSPHCSLLQRICICPDPRPVTLKLGSLRKSLVWKKNPEPSSKALNQDLQDCDLQASSQIVDLPLCSYKIPFKGPVCPYPVHSLGYSGRLTSLHRVILK